MVRTSSLQSSHIYKMRILLKGCALTFKKTICLSLQLINLRAVKGLFDTLSRKQN